MAKRRAHYVLSTHWDREWYQTFQDYRYRLVKLLDHVIDGLIDGRLKGPFTTDGQSVVLEDYLEVRPERRKSVERLAREGLLAIGPWYAMPDEFLVSGESLIRNLQLGHEVTRSLGGDPSKAGFVCDIFGHNSQLPQIFAGFGILGGFLWRGINLVDNRHFIWQGADGTALPCYRFGKVGYCSYTNLVRHAFDPDHVSDPEDAPEDLDAFLDLQAEQTPISPLLLFDGGDHQGWDVGAYGMLLQRMAQVDDDYEIVHSSLDAYLEDVLPETHLIEQRLAGELREPARFFEDQDAQWLIPGVMSSRVWIKQSNASCQNLLCHWAEPFATFAHVALDQSYPQGYLDVAWRWLIRNHPHDSICGCSIDAVHEDMKFRFHQCSGIANRLTTEAATAIAANVQGDLNDDALRVTVFNPLSTPLDEIVDLALQIPSEWPMFNEFFGFEPKPAFRIYDGAEELPYQRLAQAMNRTKTRIQYDRFPSSYRTHDVAVAVRLALPAMGYKTLTVRAGEERRPTRYPATPGLATSERSMANAYLDIAINGNGSLTITDKRTGTVYDRILTWEDVADIGDGWFHGVAVNDQAFTSTASHADVALVHDGPQRTTFRIRTTLNVPASFDFVGMVRSSEIVPLVIDSRITLRQGLDRLEIETIVANNAKDHRLRVLLPSGAHTDTYWADTPFDVVQRAIALRPDNHLYRELEIEAKPQQSWTAVADETRGLAVIADGLLETAIRDTTERPIALTLLRSTRRTVMTDGEPEGQIQGELSFRYWVRPLGGAPCFAEMCQLGQQLGAGLRVAQLRQKDIAIHRGRHSLPPSDSLLAVSGNVVVTSVRQRDTCVELRLFNPETIEVQAELRLGASLAESASLAQPVDLDGNPAGEPMRILDGIISLSVAPKRIVTLSLR